MASTPAESSSSATRRAPASSHRLKLLNKQLSLRENKHTHNAPSVLRLMRTQATWPSRSVCTSAEWVGDLAGIKLSLAPLLCTANSILEFGCQIKPFPSAPTECFTSQTQTQLLLFFCKFYDDEVHFLVIRWQLLWSLEGPCGAEGSSYVRTSTCV